MSVRTPHSDAGCATTALTDRRSTTQTGADDHPHLARVHVRRRRRPHRRPAVAMLREARLRNEALGVSGLLLAKADGSCRSSRAPRGVSRTASAAIERETAAPRREVPMSRERSTPVAWTAGRWRSATRATSRSATSRGSNTFLTERSGLPAGLAGTPADWLLRWFRGRGPDRTSRRSASPWHGTPRSRGAHHRDDTRKGGAVAALPRAWRPGDWHRGTTRADPGGGGRGVRPRRLRRHGGRRRRGAAAGCPAGHAPLPLPDEARARPRRDRRAERQDVRPSSSTPTPRRPRRSCGPRRRSPTCSAPTRSSGPASGLSLERGEFAGATSSFYEQWIAGSSTCSAWRSRAGSCGPT